MFEKVKAVNPLIAATLLMFSPGLCRAACSMTTGAFQQEQFALPATISVPRDAPNGTVLGMSETFTNAYSINCTGDSVGIYNTRGAQPGLNATLMPIGSTGISWRVSLRNGRPFYEASYGSRTLSQQEAYTVGGQYLDLVKTGPIAPGTVLPAGELGGYYFGLVNAKSLHLANAITVVTPSCSTSDVQVSLGSRRAADFSGIGSFSSQVAFSIGLECPGGLNNIRYRVDATTPVVDSAQSVVSLDSGSSATGIGIQLLNGTGSAPFPLAVLQSFNGYTGGGSYSIPLRARYYQTGGAVTGGSAKSSMTFTISYE